MPNTFAAATLVLRLLANPAQSCFHPCESRLLFEGCFIQLLYPKASFWDVPRMSSAFNQILLMLGQFLSVDVTRKQPHWSPRLDPG